MGILVTSESSWSTTLIIFRCPLDEVMTPFFPVEGTGAVRAELLMFRFNDSHEFHLQCSVSTCEDRCPPALCAEGEEDLSRDPTVLPQNREGLFVSTRVTVADHTLIASTFFCFFVAFLHCAIISGHQIPKDVVYYLYSNDAVLQTSVNN